MPNDSANVGAAKPNIGGAIFWAPAGTPVPTDATTPLSDAFKGVGYLSEEGMVEQEKRSFQNHKAWGGDTVASSQTGYEKQYGFTMIEINENTAKIRYGAGNVDVKDGKVSKITHNAKELPEGVWVAEMIVAGRIDRKVMERGKIIEVGDTPYQDNDLVKYPVTLGLLPDKNGNYEHDYFAEVA